MPQQGFFTDCSSLQLGYLHRELPALNIAVKIAVDDVDVYSHDMHNKSNFPPLQGIATRYSGELNNNLGVPNWYNY